MSFSDGVPLQFSFHGVGPIITTLANTAESVTSSIMELRSLLARQPIKVVGLDCEWRPNTIAGQVPNKVATLQLCTEFTCVVIQIFYLCPIPASLRQFLNDPNIKFVGVRVGDDALKLRDDYGLLMNPHNIVDIGCLAVSRGFQFNEPTVGLKNVARVVSNIEIDKPQYLRRSNWQARHLSDEQIMYAASDAFASFAVGYDLLVRNAFPPPPPPPPLPLYPADSSEYYYD